MSTTEWFVKLGERVVGPIDGKKLKTLANEGKVKNDTLIGNTAQGPWHQASKVKNLLPQTAMSPPPPILPVAVDNVQLPVPTQVLPNYDNERAGPRDYNGEILEQSSVTSSISRFCADGQSPTVIAKLYERVTEICTSTESVLYMAVQQKPIANIAPDCVVLTNRRFIIYRQKILGRMNFVDCLWRDCGDVHLEENIIGSTVHFVGLNGHRESLDYLPKSQARMIYRVAQEAEERSQNIRRDMRLEELSVAANKTVINQAIGTAAPQPAQSPGGGSDLVSRLTQLKQLLDAGVITQQEFDTKKASMLSQL